MDINGRNLILLPIEDTKSNYLSGFWRWVELLANDNYESAIESLFWSKPTMWTPEKLKDRISRFWGGKDAWVPVIPNQRLVNTVNDLAEFRPGWFLAQIPVTTKPSEPKDDKIPLQGVAASFFIREHGGKYVLEFEIIHA